MSNAIHPQLEKALATIHAIAHPVRARIIAHVQEKQPVLARDIYTSLHLSPAIASQQLRILKDAGLLHAKRRGREVIYTVNALKLKRVLAAATTYCTN